MPNVPVVSSCKTLQPGMRRMGDRRGFQFDAVAADFQTIEGTQDAPPSAHGFDLMPANSTARLVISFGSDLGQGPSDADPNLVFSEYSEKHRILDDEGQLIGEDYWGYLGRGKIWRRVHLHGFVYANYSDAGEQEAERFDRVINSACLLSVDGGTR